MYRKMSTHTLHQEVRTPPADERDPHQLPIALAETLADSDAADLPEACAGPTGSLPTSPGTALDHLK